MPSACTCIVTNKWWSHPSGAKGVVKNFFLRFVFSIYSVIKTAREYTVLIAGVLGVGLVLFAAWLDVTSNLQQEKARQPLVAFDFFIDDVINNLNYVTTELPNESIVWVNDTFTSIEDSVNAMFMAGENFFDATIIKGKQATEQTTNQAFKWGCFQSPTSCNPPRLSIPAWDFPEIRLPSNWRPTLNLLDLSAAAIPDRTFSAEDEVYPFIIKVFDISRTAAYYIRVAGAILLAYAALRLFIALVVPFIPHPDCLWCCGISCAKITKVTSKSIGNFLSTLAKPWIHVPILFGVCLILLAVLFLHPNIDTLEIELIEPLTEADLKTADLIRHVNEFTTMVVSEAIDWINGGINTATNVLEGDVTDILITIHGSANTVIRFHIEDIINDFLLALDGSLDPIYIPLFAATNPLITVPYDLIPLIPEFPYEEMLIPEDLVSLKKPISPWVKDRMNEMRDVADTLLMVGIWLVVIPGLICVISAAQACIPKNIENFFQDPDFDETGGKKADNDVEMKHEQP